MAKKRKVSKAFIRLMESKLQHGRERGRVGWDQRWRDCTFARFPKGPDGDIARGLLVEVAELIVALERYRRISGANSQVALEQLRLECADVANFAMFLADIHGDGLSD